MPEIDLHLVELTDMTRRGLLALLVFLICIGAGYVIAGVLNRAGRKTSLYRNRVYRLVANSQQTVFVVIGAICALGTLGVNITALVAGLGLGSFALGLALRDLVSNLVSGIMIIIYRPIDIGDEIDVAGSRGIVEDINLRYVEIRTGAELALVPNSIFINSKVVRIARAPAGAQPPPA